MGEGGGGLGVLAWDEAADEAAAAVAAAAAPYGPEGRGFQWATRVLQPGRAPGMATERARSIVRHRLTFYGAPAHHNARTAARLEEDSACSTIISAWTQDDAGGALMVSPPCGAIPEAVAGARAVHDIHPVRACMFDGALRVGGVSPAMGSCRTPA